MRLVISEIVLPEALERVRELARNPDAVLRAIGSMMVSRTKLAFRDQGRPKNTWQPRGVPNIAGILRDYHDGKSEPSADRFKARPALIDSRRLVNSISDEIEPPSTIWIGSNVAYAPTHQFGEEGVETDEITEGFQEWLGKYLGRQVTKARNAAGNEAADMVRSQLDKSLGWLLNPNSRGDRLEIDVPPRPFLDLLPEDVKDAETTAADMFSGRVPTDG